MNNSPASRTDARAAGSRPDPSPVPPVAPPSQRSPAFSCRCERPFKLGHGRVSGCRGVSASAVTRRAKNSGKDGQEKNFPRSPMCVQFKKKKKSVSASGVCMRCAISWRNSLHCRSPAAVFPRRLRLQKRAAVLHGANSSGFPRWRFPRRLNARRSSGSPR